MLAECGEQSPKLGGNTDIISALSVLLRAFLNARPMQKRHAAEAAKGAPGREDESALLDCRVSVRMRQEQRQKRKGGRYI